MSKRFVIPLWALACLSWSFGQDIDSAVIPAKTEIFVTLQRGLNTKTLNAGERFYGQVAVPVTADDRIIIPVGTSVIGHIAKARRPGYVKGKATLELTFDSVVLPDGTTRQIQAIVQSAEGYASSGINRTEGTVVAEGSQGRETAAEAAKGGVNGAVLGGIIHRDMAGAGIGALAGAAGGAILGIFKRGSDIELRKGDSVTIVLTDAVRFVKPQPAPEGEMLR